MAERRGMGRGLGAILPESATGPDMRELPVKSIDRNPGQPRTNFSEEALESLPDARRNIERAAEAAASLAPNG